MYLGATNTDAIAQGSTEPTLPWLTDRVEAALGLDRAGPHQSLRSAFSPAAMPASSIAPKPNSKPARSCGPR